MLISLPMATARAAEVVDLRVGVHPEYTRVVLELDGPAAYQVKRSGGQSELVVSLDAGSIVRDVEASKGLIGRVTLVPTAQGSKARIKLLDEGLNLKQMLLANPPRIVLDVSRPKPKQAEAPAATKPVAKAPAPKRAKPAAKPKPEVPAKAAAPLAKAKPAPKATAKATPKPTPKATPTPTPAPKAKPAKIIAVAPKPTKPIIKVEAPKEPVPAASPPRKQASPPPAAAPKRAEAKPPAVSPKVEVETSTGSAKQIFALVGLVALVVVWVMIRRRRGRVPLPSKSRHSTLSDQAGDDAANPFAALESDGQTREVSSSDTRPALDDSPFGDMGDELAEEETTLPASSSSSSGLSAGEFLRREAESAVRGSTATASETPEPPSEPSGVDPYEAGRSAGREAAAEAMALVRGLEEKIASLQERLGDAVDSRERIERQIAAQNEELRVQRAAIARTQRAVRNISRPDEDEDRSDPAGPAAD